MTPIRYRPGARCALAYRLGGPSGTHHFFGKLFRQPDPQRMAALPLLYARAQADAALPRVPRPLAYWPDLHLLILPVVNGAELHEVVFDATVPLAVRVAWFVQLGAKVAALHNLAPLALPHRTLAADLADLAIYVPIMERLLPTLAPAYAATLQALTVIAPTLPAAVPVVCHGALRTDQFLLTKSEPPCEAAEELMLIDLDTLCLAHPAADIGNCLAYLQWKAIRQPQHAMLIAQAEQALLTGYAAVRGLPPAASIALYRAVALLKIAGRRFPNLTYREWPLTPQLVQAAQDLIATTPLNAGSVSAL
ncbi:MAG: aminoglycoside phosphotransferase family protein [Caldilineaceae bacterium]